MDSSGETRIQRENRSRILSAGLEVFSAAGFNGATLDAIARAAELSKPNLLYYFPSKKAIYTALLDRLLDTWLDPLRALDPEGEPMDEMLSYVGRKLTLARDYPRESRLFAGEILRGAPHLKSELSGPLRVLVLEKGRIVRAWMDAGHLAKSDPRHLIMSIWALTQHYADFEVQVRAVLGPGHDPWVEAEQEVITHFRRVLAP
ncbi:TetR family transcriptional regulator C-terminal domain-containing protein [Jannaschia aquimarina]|uniref:RutR_2 protein n=1 Tax=Jannaschia aquimarina TaxID=935700 RepID=A0A0D1EH06_9RHOB|nr:TetR family transcriptional regulator C-terminal domain-containing protein [Jannaschia aquimarina]KIT16934.1 HTH-type transcriptional regulator RutR [Jannaschia aquimarina]SNT11269.1 transcriptional regulator, TetR family [Jannaschia aquimarina]